MEFHAQTPITYFQADLSLARPFLASPVGYGTKRIPRTAQGATAAIAEMHKIGASGSVSVRSPGA